MASRISFTIAAVDKATATIKSINDSVSKMSRPYKELGKSVKQFSDVSGLTQFGKKLQSAAASGAKLLGSLAKIGAPLLTLIGGGTIAGITEMAIAWARVGAETERTAVLLGISSARLTEMRGGAQLAGVSAEDLTSGFRSLADTLQDAKWGRNQGAMSALMAMGITLHATKTGAVDTDRAMLDLADRVKVLQKNDPAAARNLARMFGVENLLPMLARGSEGMRAYQQEAARLRGAFTPDMAARASAFALSTSKLSLSVEGLKASVADRLMPVIQPMIEGLTNWVVANRELIGTRVAEYAQMLADWIKKIDWKEVWAETQAIAVGFISFCKTVSSTVEMLGGMKTVMLAVGVYMAGGFVASMVSATASLVTLLAKLALLGGSGGLGLLGKLSALPGAGGIGLLGKLGALRGAGGFAAAGALGSVGLVAGAGGLGYTAGTVINDAMQSHGIHLGAWLYDRLHPEGKSETGELKDVVQSLMKMGWTKEQSAGIAANLATESGFHTSSVGDGGKAYGIAQWHEDRQDAFKKRFGHDIRESSLEEQLRFVNFELTEGSEKAAGKRLKSATTASDAAGIVSRYYERPLKADDEAARRSALAQFMFASKTLAEPASSPAMAVATPTASPPSPVMAVATPPASPASPMMAVTMPPASPPSPVMAVATPPASPPSPVMAVAMPPASPPSPAMAITVQADKPTSLVMPTDGLSSLANFDRTGALKHTGDRSMSVDPAVDPAARSSNEEAAPEPYRLPSLNQKPAPSAYDRPSAASDTAPVIVKVDNHVTVNKDGSVTIKTATPSSLKIETVMPS